MFLSIDFSVVIDIMYVNLCSLVSFNLCENVLKPIPLGHKLPNGIGSYNGLIFSNLLTDSL